MAMHLCLPTVKHLIAVASNICCLFLLFTENDILTHLNFGIHDIPWLQKLKNTVYAVIFAVLGQKYAH